MGVSVGVAMTCGHLMYLWTRLKMLGYFGFWLFRAFAFAALVCSGVLWPAPSVPSVFGQNCGKCQTWFRPPHLPNWLGLERRLPDAGAGSTRSSGAPEAGRGDPGASQVHPRRVPGAVEPLTILIWTVNDHQSTLDQSPS